MGLRIWPNELARALYRLRGAGLRATKAMQALKQSADLAALREQR